jgi:phosphoadenosine phosphosulfate reductase
MSETISNEDWEGRRPEDLLARVFELYGTDAALSCSFGGTSGMVLLDMAARVFPRVRVTTLDTDFLFPETYALIARAEAHYGITVERVRTSLSPEAQADQFGEALWESDSDACCRIRKVEPMREAMAGLKAWITGIRRDQSPTRRETPAVTWDDKFSLVKVNPLVAWTEKDVWAYIVENDVPYNPLHDQGYASIGCTHCTRPIQIGEDLRAGRWSGSAKLECGLHK